MVLRLFVIAAVYRRRGSFAFVILPFLRGAPMPAITWFGAHLMHLISVCKKPIKQPQVILPQRL